MLAGCDAFGGGDDVAGRISGEGALFGRGLALSQDYLAVRSVTGDDDRVAVYRLTGGRPVKMATLRDQREREGFGISLDFAGETLVTHGVGRLGDDRSDPLPPGQLYAFDRTGETWELSAVIAPEGVAHNYGGGVKARGDLLAAKAGDRVHLYERQPSGAWALADSLLVPGYTFNQVHFEEDRIFAASSEGRRYFPGREEPIVVERATVHVFERAGGEGWTKATDFMVPETDINGCFGMFLTVVAGYAAVGAPCLDEEGLDVKGAVYLYREDGGAWTLAQRLTSEQRIRPGERRVGSYGHTLASASTPQGAFLFVGSEFENAVHGRVYVYKLGENGTWETHQVLEAPADEVSAFGQTVRAAGEVLAVSAPQEDGERGAVYLYRLRENGRWER